MLSETACPDKSGKSRLAGKNLSLLYIAFLLLQFTTLAQEGWIEQTFDTTLNFSSAHFVNENIGWIVGWEGVYDTISGYVYKTTNGGNQWQKQIGDTVPELRSVNFVTENFGCAVGYSGTILITTNGGEIWDDKSLDGGRWRDVQFLSENVGYAVNAVGPGGKNHQNTSERVGYTYLSDVIRTTDGGNNWVGVGPAGQSYAYQCLSFVNSDVGYLTHIFADSLNYPILKTTNGGQEWDSLRVSGTFIGIGKIFFITELTGWIVGGEGGDVIGVIRKTTDGGINWVNQYYGGGFIRDVHFVNENISWAVGDSGVILNTTDGGDNWSSQTSGTEEILTSVCFVNQNTGWIVGYSGIMLKTTNGGVSFVEEQEIDEIPTDFSLSQNYPNPFNPSTKIRYSVPQSSNVVIKVFDVLGNVIEILVDKEKPLGTYEITLYAENYPSGVYFYRLQAGSFVETKKMVLLR